MSLHKLTAPLPLAVVCTAFLFGIPFQAGRWRTLKKLIDAALHRSIIAALQSHVQENPSVFSLGSLEGGVPSFHDGMRYPYFDGDGRSYGEYFTSYRHLDGGEQGHVFLMDTVSPAAWLKKLKYDGARPGSVSIKISSILDGYMDGHSNTVDIPLS